MTTASPPSPQRPHRGRSHLADGGDNIGVYVPVLLAVGAGALVAYCVVFLPLVAVLVLATKFVATRKPVAEVLERWERILFPSSSPCWVSSS